MGTNNIFNKVINKESPFSLLIPPNHIPLPHEKVGICFKVMFLCFLILFEYLYQFTTCMTIGAQIKLDKAHLPLIFPDLWLGMQ